MKDIVKFGSDFFNMNLAKHNDTYCWWNGSQYIPLNKLQIAKLEGNYELYLKQVPLELLREERNKRLAEEDWRILRAYSQGVEISSEWKEYLQTLRDLPENSEPLLDENNNLINVDWPIKPNT